MPETPYRIIFHIDLNAFFVSCELISRPELTAKPVAVTGPTNTDRGVITAANYVARTYGVHSAMPTKQAFKKCPHLVTLPANFELYRRVSRQFMILLGEYGTLIEKASIDEAYVDMTHYFPATHPLALAEEIQRRVRKELQVGCSIGVAPNKFLAKMASDMKKPNGITILRKRDLSHLLWPLPVEDMHGIGKSSAPKLRQLGIETIGDLAGIKEMARLEHFFGSQAYKWVGRARGIDERPVDPHRYEIPSSIGHSTTFSKDYSFELEIKGEAKHMSLKTAYRLKTYGLYAKTITLQLKYSDFKQVSRSKTLKVPVQMMDEIYPIIEELFDEHWNTEPIRLIGVSASNLVQTKKVTQQLDLFNYQLFSQEEKVNQTLQQIKKEHGRMAIQKGMKKGEKYD